MPKAFIVYSSISHVPYINSVLEVIESILKSMDIEPYYLGIEIKGEELYPLKLQEMITQSDMGIVILDGMRPNVAFEYGLLVMKNIDIIPLKKKDAKYSIKSLFYNPAVNNLDPTLAFGDYRFKKAALKNLKEPLLDVIKHFSDCQGKHIVEFDTIDDTNESTSLGNLLRGYTENIIPKLRSRDGPGFEELHLLFLDLENHDLLDESIRLLSLFSFLGWRQGSEGDLQFKYIREGFLSLFQNEQTDIEEVNLIFEQLLESDQPILRNYGRYLTVDSDRLINESFEYFFNNESIFIQLIRSILRSDIVELITRFIERISVTETLEIKRRRSISQHIFSRSGLFQDISVLQNRELCRLFSRVAQISPTTALDKLNTWINPLSPMKIAEKFSYQSTLGLPGNPQDEVLWFLSRISKYNTFYVQAMNILFKFSIPVIVNEEQVLGHVHSSVHKLSLDRFLEQCHFLLGEVDVRTLWNFIQNLSWGEDWPEDYIDSTKDLKFRAIITFLLRFWSISGPVVEGSIKITYYKIPDHFTYNELKTCRAEAYRILMDWLDQPEEFSIIFNPLFEYFYRNLSEWLTFVPWEEMKSLFERIFIHDSRKILIFIHHIDLLRAFDNEVWQGSYSEEHLIKIFQFQENLEKNLSTYDFYRRKMAFSIYSTNILKMFPEQSDRENHINTIQTELINHYIKLGESKMEEITKLLLSENFDRSYQFGVKLKDLLTEDEIKAKIKSCSDLININRIENISEFFIGLWNALFSINEERWESLLEHYWGNSFIQPYLFAILWRTDRSINEYRWKKFKELFMSRQIKPVQIIDVIQHKELPLSVSTNDKRLLLVDSIIYINEIIEEEIRYPIESHLSFIWRLEQLISGEEDLLNEEIARIFLDVFYPISGDILSQLYKTEFIKKLGQFSQESLKKWLKVGFKLNQDGVDFLTNYADDFIDLIFEVAEQLFTASEEGEKFSASPEILLKFTDEQIDRLYELNSPMLGSGFGRLIRNSPIDDDFPEALRRLIIQHNKDKNFKNSILHEFSTKISSFRGNNYDQQYDKYLEQVFKWKESPTNSILIEWLEELSKYIDSLKIRNRDTWEELEIN